MKAVLSSRCHNCQKVATTTELVDNPAGIGMVCADAQTCQVRAVEQWRAQESEKVSGSGKTGAVFPAVLPEVIYGKS